MGKLDELDKLDKAIKDGEIRLKSVQLNIEQMSNEINVLEPRKNELEQNIQFHKNENTVPIAQEYKKSRAELSKTKARLILIKADYKKALQACKEIETILEKFKRDHAALLKTSENNVLRPTFGVKRGKK